MDDAFCPVCCTYFSENGALNRHLNLKKDAKHKEYLITRFKRVSQVVTDSSQNVSSSTAKSTSGVKKRKAAVELNYPDSGSESSDGNEDEEDDLPPTAVENIDHDDPIMANINKLLEFYNAEKEEDLFQFVQPAEDGVEGIAGPGPSTMQYRQYGRILEDDEDLRVSYDYEGAGQCIGIDKDAQTRWKTIFGKEGASYNFQPTNGYFPFASELDWKIAHWAITEKVSQTAMDKLLKIPEVVTLLSFSLKTFRG